MTRSLCLLSLGLIASGHALGQVSLRSDSVDNIPQYDNFVHWTGYDVQWYGRQLNLVAEGLLDGIPASGDSFTQGYTGNTFAYSITAVEDWNYSKAIDALEGTSTVHANFAEYIGSRQPARVNRHQGDDHGFGVDNGDSDNRDDKIDDPGEALVLTFDLEGNTPMDDADSTFGPDERFPFENKGLHPYAKLYIHEVIMWNWAPRNFNGRLDYLFYDASEGTFIQSIEGQSTGEDYNIDHESDGDRTISGKWEIEHGDMLILAHPTNADGSSTDLDAITAELSGITFDLEFDPPAVTTPEIPADPYNPEHFTQHPYQPMGRLAFPNIWREDGELLGKYRTEKLPDGTFNESIRTVVMGFHRGLLLTENRGTQGRGSRIMFDLSEATLATGLNHDPDDESRRPVEVERQTEGRAGIMHTAYWLAPELRTNDGNNNYADLSDPLNIRYVGVPQASDPGALDDYVGLFPDNARSAYLPPYHYLSIMKDGVEIWDARTGVRQSALSEHGFDALVMPVGNILLMARVRSGERAVASYDISDPANPVLLDVMRESDPDWRNQKAGAYEPAVYKNYLVTPMAAGGGTIAFLDYEDPTNLRMQHIIEDTRGSQRYVQFQDHRMFAGTEVIDLTYLDGGMSSTEHTFAHHQGEYMLPLGNLVVCAENSAQGSESLAAIYAFQAEPDERAPTVAYHVPKDGATGQKITSRVGIITHDTLDLTTITPETLKMVALDGPNAGTEVVGTRNLSDKDIITFTPNQNLDENVTYQVIVDGFTDIVGNPVEPYSFEFTTGNENTPFYPIINNVGFSNEGDLLVNEPVNFFIDASPSGNDVQGNLEYRWEFGDGNFTNWSADNATVSYNYDLPGQSTVIARVRSTEAPERAAAYIIRPVLYQKAAGEDGFEPTFEGEKASYGNFQATPDTRGASEGYVGKGDLIGWEFEAVRGVYDFKVVQRSERRNRTRISDVYFSEQTGEDAEGNRIYSEPVFLTQFINVKEDSKDWVEHVETLYLPKTGRYRFELRKTPGEKTPLVDYLIVALAADGVRFEAESTLSDNITGGTIVEDENASNGSYLSGDSSFNLSIDFYAESEGNYTFAFNVKSSGSTGALEVFLNGVSIQTLTTDSANFAEIPVEMALAKDSTNLIEIRAVSGTDRLDLDHFALKAIPAYIKEIPLTPRHSSQIALHPDLRQIFAVNPDNASITALPADLPTDSEWARNFERSVGETPRSLAIDKNGLVWVPCFDGDIIRVVDPENAANDFDIPLDYGDAPHDIVFDYTGQYAFVSLYGSGEIMRINADNVNETSRITVGPTPRALALNAEDSLLFATRYISPADYGEVYRVSIDLESDTMTLLDPVVLIKDEVSEDGPLSGRGVLNYLSSITISPANEQVYVGSQKVNTIAGNFRTKDLDTPKGLTHETTVRPIIAIFDQDATQDSIEDRMDLDDASQPSSLAFSPRGDFLFVGIQGNNEVFVINQTTKTKDASLPCGLAPQGLLVDPETENLFVKDFMDRSVTVHSLENAFSSGNFAGTFLDNASTVENDVLVGDILQGKQIFYNASDARMGRNSYISCASCHQDGGHDGVVWDFTQRGEGFRNTTDLRGRSGMGHGNVHWSGNFDEIQDFELDMVLHQAGRGFIQGDPNPSMGAPNAGRSPELDALAAYVESLGKSSLGRSPHRQSDGTVTSNALLGKRLFEGAISPASGHTLNCMECHGSDQQFTDSILYTGEDLGAGRLHNIGTLKDSSGSRLGDSLVGIDTPTLWGLHSGAPYLHDGRAETIEEVFDYFIEGAATGTPGSAHNLSATGYNLTAEEKESLIAYLHQIDGTDLAKMNAQTWMASWGDDIGSSEADFDGDQISNFAEYVLGGDPTQQDSSSQMAKIVFDGTASYFRFNRRGNDDSLRYIIERSTDLQSWEEYQALDQTTLPTETILEELLVEISTEELKEFFRLNVESVD
ncbi:MAG: Ig-like domain-containing protein [Opitutales bacterium]